MEIIKEFKNKIALVLEDRDEHYILSHMDLVYKNTLYYEVYPKKKHTKKQVLKRAEALIKEIESNVRRRKRNG